MALKIRKIKARCCHWWHGQHARSSDKVWLGLGLLIPPSPGEIIFKVATNLETKSLHLVADVEVSVAEQVEADVEKRRVVLKDGDGETPELKQVRKKVWACLRC